MVMGLKMAMLQNGLGLKMASNPKVDLDWQIIELFTVSKRDNVSVYFTMKVQLQECTTSYYIKVIIGLQNEILKRSYYNRSTKSYF